jgi:hypothetical protein
MKKLAPPRGGARFPFQVVLIIFQVAPFQMPVRAKPDRVPNLPTVPTAMQEVGEAHVSDHKTLPCPVGGEMTRTVHAEPFQVATAACPWVQLLVYGPTPPAATQEVADVQETQFRKLCWPAGIGTGVSDQVPAACTAANVNVVSVPSLWNCVVSPVMVHAVVETQATPSISLTSPRMQETPVKKYHGAVRTDWQIS